MAQCPSARKMPCSVAIDSKVTNVLRSSFLVLIFVLLASSQYNLVAAQPTPAPVALAMNTSDVQGLQAIARHWAALTTLSSLPWTNLASACTGATTSNVYGVTCGNNGGLAVVTAIKIDEQYAENKTDTLPALSSFFSKLATMTIYNQAIQPATQDSLTLPTLNVFVWINVTGISLVNASALTGLHTATFDFCPDLITIAAFSNATSNLAVSISGNPSLTTVQGPFPSHLNALTVVSCPQLMTLPSMTTLSILTSITFIDLPWTSLPILPTAAVLTAIKLQDMIFLTSLPATVSTYSLNQFLLSNCSGITSSLPIIKNTSMTAMHLNYMGLNDTNFPGAWFCNFVRLSWLELAGNNFTTIPSCISNMTLLYHLSLDSAGAGITTLPAWVFNSPSMQQLYLTDLPGLIYDAAFINISWNLPLLTDIEVPGDFIRYNMPASGVVCRANWICMLTIVSPVNGPISDDYFNRWANGTEIYASGMNITGTIPTSLQNVSALEALDFSNNTLTGTVPLAPIQLTQMYYVDLSGNYLNGTLPNMSSIYPNAIANSYSPYLNLSDNAFDLCSSTAFAVPNFTTLDWCSVGGDCTACSATLVFAGCTIESCTPNVVPSPPVSPPTAPVAPLCDGYPAPSVGTWICTPTGWASNSSIVTTEPITVPPSVVVVSGNLTSPQIIISGLNSSVVAEGCNTIQSLQVNLTLHDINQLAGAASNRTLLAQNSSLNCAPISQIPLTVVAPSGCQQVSSTVTSSDPSTLTALFTVDESKCGGSGFSLWWIILASVLGGVLLIVVLLVAICVCNRKRKIGQERYRIDSAARTMNTK